MQTITITRTDSDIYTVTSSLPYWSDGSCINERLAFDGPRLSSSRAQSIDRANGRRYLLISSFGIKRTDICSAAAIMPVGASITFSV